MNNGERVAWITSDELNINNTVINNKLALDSQWLITFDSTDGLILKKFST